MGDLLSIMLPSARSAEAQVNPGLLHRVQPGKPTVVVNEQPWMRAAAHMFAAGLATKEVAEACGHSTQTLYKLLRTPWFQELVTELIAKHGGKDIQTFFKGEQINSFLTLLEIRDNERNSAAVRASVAIRIIEQEVGKPTQKVELGHASHGGDPVAEVARLEAENKRMSQ